MKSKFPRRFWVFLLAIAAFTLRQSRKPASERPRSFAPVAQRTIQTSPLLLANSYWSPFLRFRFAAICPARAAPSTPSLGGAISNPILM